MAKRKRGRPALGDEDRKAGSIRIRLTKAERARIEVLARAKGLTLSEYLRKQGGA